MGDGYESEYRALFENRSEVQLRAFCIKTLRDLRRGPGDKASTVKWDFSTFANRLLPLLASDRNVAVPRGPGLHHHLDKVWASPLLDFFAWLERTGLAYCLGREIDGPFRSARFTQRGLEFFDAKHDDHPLLPGWLERLQKQCPALDDEIVVLLDDSQSCAEHALYRAAVILLGVAFEAVMGKVRASMLGKNYTLSKPNGWKAWEIVEAVRSGINQRYPGKSIADQEAKGAAERACLFVDHLRDRRNNGSHPNPTNPINDAAEVEPLFYESRRHLPALWALL